MVKPNARARPGRAGPARRRLPLRRPGCPRRRGWPCCSTPGGGTRTARSGTLRIAGDGELRPLAERGRGRARRRDLPRPAGPGAGCAAARRDVVRGGRRADLARRAADGDPRGAGRRPAGARHRAGRHPVPGRRRAAGPCRRRRTRWPPPCRSPAPARPRCPAPPGALRAHLPPRRGHQHLLDIYSRHAPRSTAPPPSVAIPLASGAQPGRAMRRRSCVARLVRSQRSTRRVSRGPGAVTRARSIASARQLGDDGNRRCGSRCGESHHGAVQHDRQPPVRVLPDPAAAEVRVRVGDAAQADSRSSGAQGGAGGEGDAGQQEAAVDHGERDRRTQIVHCGATVSTSAGQRRSPRRSRGPA